jgi:hypothetical protein
VAQPRWLSERIRRSGKSSRIDYGVAHLRVVVLSFCQHIPESPKTVRIQFIQRVSTPTRRLPLSTLLDVSLNDPAAEVEWPAPVSRQLNQ